MLVDKEDLSRQKYSVCCCHAETCAFFLAFVTLLTVPLGFVGELLRAAKLDEAPDMVILVGSSVNFVCSLFVILAQCNRQPHFYLPYFYIMAVTLLALFLNLHNMISIFDYIIASERFSTNFNANNSSEGPYTRQYLAVAVPAYGVWLCFSSIAYYVNWIAWRFLKEENKANAFASDVEA